MDIHLPLLYKIFAKYDNYRSFPSFIDGLKPVERRVLYTAFLEANGGKFVKCARIQGICCGKFHPHGDCYGSIVKMSNIGFLDKQGNFGTRIGQEAEKPAAMRYTETKMNILTRNLAFKYIKYVPMDTSDFDEKEPRYLPTMFPFCLLGKVGEEYTQGIGTGYKSYFPFYNMIDLFKRLLWVLGKLEVEPIIKPLTDCIITSTNSDLKELLTLPKKKLTYRGVIKIDKKICKIILKSFPPNKTFAGIYKKFKNETDNGDVGYRDSSAGKETSLVFTILKKRNRDKIFQSVLNKLIKQTTSTITFLLNSIDENGDVYPTTVDEMLLNTYNVFKKANEDMLNSEIQRLTEIEIELINLEKIKQPLATVLQGGQLTKNNFEQKALQVSQMANLNEDIVKGLLAKYRIQKLFSVSTDTTEIKSQIIQLQTNLNNLDDFVLDQYYNFKAE